MSSLRRAFVAGATGYTGSAVVEVLRENDVETVAHVRPDSSRITEWRTRFAEMGARVDVTPWHAQSMSATIRDLRPPHVFALIGTTLARVRRGSDSSVPDSYEAVDLALTKILIDAGVAAGSVERFVYLSAAGARAGTRNPYLKIRVELEALVRASGLEFTILRPAFVSGPDREEARPLERLGARTIDVGLALAAAFGAREFAARYKSISGPILARGLVRAALDPAYAGRSVHSGELRALS